MSPTKRRPVAPASQGPTRTAPDVPVVAPDGPGAESRDGAQLLGPEGEPISQDAPRVATPRDPAPPAEPLRADAEVRAAQQAPGRPLSTYPLPVWPD